MRGLVWKSHCKGRAFFCFTKSADYKELCQKPALLFSRDHILGTVLTYGDSSNTNCSQDWRKTSDPSADSHSVTLNSSPDRKRKFNLLLEESTSTNLTTNSSVAERTPSSGNSLAGASVPSDSCISMLLNSEEFALNNYYDLENLEEEFVPSEEFVNLE